MFNFYKQRAPSPSLTTGTPEAALNVSASAGSPELVVNDDHDAIKQPTALVVAGFWRRAAALVIDDVLVALSLGLPGALFFYGCIVSGRLAPGTSSKNDYLILAGLAMLFVYAIGPCLYFAFFESSKQQATPGKRLLGLRVVSKDGGKFPFWNCVKKWTLQWLIFGIVMVAAVIVGFVKFHEWPLTCLSAAALYYLLGFGIVVFNNRRQTLFDKLSGRFVVRALPAHVLPQQSSAISKIWCTPSERWMLIAIGIGLVFTLQGKEGPINRWLNIDAASLISEVTTESGTRNTTGKAVVAKHNLAAGHIMAKDDVELVNFGALRTPRWSLSNPGLLPGSLLLSPLKSGDIFYPEQFVKRNCKITKLIENRAMSNSEISALKLQEINRQIASCALEKDSIYSRPEARDIWRDEMKQLGLSTDCVETQKLSPGKAYDLVKAYKARAVLRNEMHQYKLALADYNRVLKISPADEEILALRAKVNYNLHQFKLVIADCNRILKELTEDVDALSLRANAHLQMRQYKLALADCDHILNNDAENVVIQALRARIKSQTGQGARPIHTKLRRQQSK